MFWLGNARGAHGLATLQQVLRNDPSVEVKKAAVFGVSQSREAAAFDVLGGPGPQRRGAQGAQRSDVLAGAEGRSARRRP